jgi:ribonuclease III
MCASPHSHGWLDEFEKTIGYAFNDKSRVSRAMTHASARDADGSDYERLEFLGDRVLGLTIAELLFNRLPAAHEGDLSVRLNQLVDAETCAEIADEIGITRFIKTGSDIRSLSGKRRQNIRADVMESLIAIIYIDGGLEAARPFILRHWEARALSPLSAHRDAKTALQEWAHRQNGLHPLYIVEKRDGPDHEPVFTVSVKVGNLEPGFGAGPSKREAEQNAAASFLIREKVWKDGDFDPNEYEL